MKRGPWVLLNMETGERLRWDEQVGDWVPVPPRRKPARPNATTRRRRRERAEATGER